MENEKKERISREMVHDITKVAIPGMGEFETATVRSVRKWLESMDPDAPVIIGDVTPKDEERGVESAASLSVMVRIANPIGGYTVVFGGPGWAKMACKLADSINALPDDEYERVQEGFKATFGKKGQA